MKIQLVAGFLALILAGAALEALTLGDGPSTRPAVRPDPAAADAPGAAPTDRRAVRTTAAQLEFAVSDRTGFVDLGPPEPGDWLASHPERGQTFEQYAASDPVRAEGGRRELAFLPIGPFAQAEERQVKAVVEFAGLWYDLPVVLLRPERLPPLSPKWSRTKSGRTQFRTRHFLDGVLRDRLETRHAAVIGVTMSDLYPGASWNYVFGEAYFHERVGIYSLARFSAAFADRDETPQTRRLALLRSIKLVTHELGHVFGMEHCTAYRCNMNGSNSLAETDGQPLPLCPVCLKKLAWNRSFDVLARYRRLQRFHERHGLKDQAAWTRERIARIAAEGR